MEIISTLEKFLRKYKVEDNIGVAFSGGIDSTVLAHGLIQLGINDKLTLLYINHHLRPDADHEAKFVEYWAGKYGLALQKFDVTIEKNSNIEEMAREKRYNNLREWANKNRSVVFTAHHQDDQIETILYRIFTGTGINGLAGIVEENDKIYRPFLAVSREQIKSYCKQNNLEYYDDPSNSENRFKRNALRNKIVPMIVDHFGTHAAKHILNLPKRFEEYFDSRWDILDYLKRNNWIKYSNHQIVVEKRIFFLYFPSFTKFLIEASIRDVFDKNLILSEKNWSDIYGKRVKIDTKFQLTEDLTIFFTTDEVVIQDCFVEEKIEIDLRNQFSGHIQWYNWHIQWEFVENQHELQFDSLSTGIDIDRSGNLLTIDNPVPGMRYQKANNTFISEISKVFSDAKIAVPERKRMPVIYNSDNDIVCGPHLGTADKFAVKKHSNKILFFKFRLTE